MRNVWLGLAIVVGMAASCSGDGLVRPIFEFNGVLYGATCDDDADCGGEDNSCCKGGKCSGDGWCSPICDSDQDCPEGFYCVDHAGKRCFAACEDDRDCPTDFICDDKDGHLTCRF